MKKLGIFALAFALVLGLSQCKKENTTSTNNEGSKVPITLNVGGGNGSRVAVEGSTGVVTFEDGDVIYVASNGTCVGTLTYNGENFAGEVTEPTEGQKLQFYFLGNKTPEFNADNTGCSVVISDQTEYLPVISYAPSRENYQIGKTDYNATLLNKCALVKFNVTSASEAATCIVGMNNKVTVDFTDNSFEYGQDGEGIIAMPAGNGEKWAILLPQDGITHTDAYSTDGLYTGSCATIPAIEENGYLTNGIAVAINLPGGAIDGLFSVSETQQVYFSQGNLQYQASTDIWRFAENQWDYVGTQTPDNSGNVGGTVGGSDNRNISSTYSGWIDMFGWGTSDYNHGAVCYQPWSTSQDYTQYFAYGISSYSLYDQNGQADWGYNAISNGGNTENSGWRTLTREEWMYVFSSRNTVSGIRWVQGTVNGINGTILLPDNWNSSIYTLNNPNGGNYNSNTISAEDWTNALEANGAVFLPAAGSRVGTSVYTVGSSALYWGSTRRADIYAHFLYFYNGSVVTDNYGRIYDGFTVRLVRNAE